MERKRIISVKNSKLLKEYNTFMKNIEHCLAIANEATESILNGTADEETIPFGQSYAATTENMDTFIDLFHRFNQEIYKSYSMLNLAENHIDEQNFTLPESVVDEYKENDVGECIISNIDCVPQNHCHIFNVKKPPLNWKEHQGKRFTTLPEAGQVFGIEFGSDGLYRAVRNDFIKKASESILIQLIDTGEYSHIQNDCKNMYKLPKGIKSIKSCAFLCKILEISDEFGNSVNIDDCVKRLLGKQVNFKVVKIKNNVPHIKIFLSNQAIDAIYSTDLAGNELLFSDIVIKKEEFNDVQAHSAEMEPDSQEINVDINMKFIISNYEQTKSEIPSNYICDICNVGFYAKNKLQDHMREHISMMSLEETKLQYQGRTEKGRYQCKECRKSFDFKTHFIRHISTHSIEKPFWCKFCGKSFRQNTNLINHIRTHTGEKPFSCSFCRKSFVQVSQLKTHLRTHTGEKPFSCNQCKKVFTQKSHLDSHFRLHTGDKPYPCTICGISFKYHSSLIYHKEKH